MNVRTARRSFASLALAGALAVTLTACGPTSQSATDTAATDTAAAPSQAATAPASTTSSAAGTHGATGTKEATGASAGNGARTTRPSAPATSVSPKATGAAQTTKPAKPATSTKPATTKDAPGQSLGEQDAKDAARALEAAGRAALEPVLPTIEKREQGAVDLAASDFSHYSATAEVSYIRLVFEGGAGEQVVLVHRGTPVQTALAYGWGGTTVIDQIDATTLRLRGYYEDSTEQYFEFLQIWDEELGRFVYRQHFDNGDARLTQFGAYALSPEHPVPTGRELPPAADPAAGGLIPWGTPTLDDDPEIDLFTTTVLTVAGVDGMEILLNERGAHVQASAGRDTWEQTLLENPGLGGSVISAGGRSEPGDDGEPVVRRVVAPGESVSFGPYVVVASQDGATVWDSATGHGIVSVAGRLEFF